MKPTINIKRGKLIEPFFKAYVESKYDNFVFPSENEVLEKIKLFKEAWLKEEDIFLEFIFGEMNSKFKRNTIDCFIVSATPRDMSAPLIIRSRWSADEFVDVLMHELIHIFLSDNKIPKIENKNNNSETTINHIMVFALLKKFYIEVLKDEGRLERVISKSSPDNNVDYYKAWQKVEEVGYDIIIDEMKKPLIKL